MLEPQQIFVEDASQPGEARRLATALCYALSFDELRTSQIALLVTELATNLVKHTEGVGGLLIFSPFAVGDAVGLDILSLNTGSGIGNIAESLRDGYSTTGTTGGGLGAIRRLSDEFDIFSAPQQGVALLSRCRSVSPSVPSHRLTVGAVCLPIKGEEVCGDAWSMKLGGDATLFLLVDGLGHGSEAAMAAKQAVETFQQQAPRSPKELVHLLHAALRHTRGAAIAVAEVAMGRRTLNFAGLGNISARLATEQGSQNLISHNGTAGVYAPNIQEFSYPWSEDSQLIMHSDGVATHWSLAAYPGLNLKHPALIAGVLYRDFQRLRDDSCVLIVKAAARLSV